MKTVRSSFTGLLAAALLVPQPTDPGGRIYGRVETVTGVVHVGFIRWFQGESSWSDLLPGSKSLPKENFDQVRRLRAAADPEADRAARTIEFNGVRITWDEDDLESLPQRAESGVRFARVLGVEPVGDEALLVRLRSGGQVELTLLPNGGDDRVVVVESGAGETQVAWSEVRGVELMGAPPSESPRSRRAHGTVTDRLGNRYSGEIAWAGVAARESDMIVQPGPLRASGLSFADVSVLERLSRSQARVTFTSGETVTLGAEERGPRFAGRAVRVSDPTFGQIQIPWNDLGELRLDSSVQPAPAFAPDGHRLRGTVLTQSGERHVGWIRWDNDEEYDWELLNGRVGNRIFAIELSHIQEIRRRSARNADVTLRDGRTFQLDGSNDVGWGNKGIVIEKDDGTLHFVDWVAFQVLTLEVP